LAVDRATDRATDRAAGALALLAFGSGFLAVAFLASLAPADRGAARPPARGRARAAPFLAGVAVHLLADAVAAFLTTFAPLPGVAFDLDAPVRPAAARPTVRPADPLVAPGLVVAPLVATFLAAFLTAFVPALLD
jgi:hypothetical protein